jgi:acyl-[acyl-carrier-protein]-phospholipid O-acyltransferase/long-chain-fatty-acid--[acyl-carrier-protein] ligase
MLAVAALGYAASRFIPGAPAPTPGLRLSKNIAAATWRILQHDRQNKKVFGAILAISWFWLVGATFLSQFPAFAKDTLGSDETVVTLMLTLFSLGIGLGSFLCTKLLGGEVKATFVPYAALGITLFSIDLFLASGAGAAPGPNVPLLNAAQFMADSGHWRVMLDLLGVAASGGLYIVPLYAIMQHDSDPASRARTIASNNILNALFMVASALATVAMLKAHFSVPQVFLSVGLANAPVAAWIFYSLRR